MLTQHKIWKTSKMLMLLTRRRSITHVDLENINQFPHNNTAGLKVGCVV